MNCKKVRRLLPLMVGSEIPQSKILSLKAHLEECPKCRQEYDSYNLSLEQTKEWLAKDRIDWEEYEWQQALQSAIKDKKPEVTALVSWPFKKAWAYSIIGVLVVALTLLLIIRPSIMQKKMGLGSEKFTEEQAQLFRSSPEESEQDVVSMTLVSKETGLKIVWFLNKNFELEVKE
ncbi:MAG: hypothetical protein GTO16_04265 [Candidatus Aminicenantes bacterium]|nr:hypothetical protein [Candidatus Aminicenantes bacterium]